MVVPSPSALIDQYQTISFSHQSLAYDDKGRLYLPHNARFRPGRFGQAVQVEEGTTNLYGADASRCATWNGWGGSVVIVTPGQTDPFGGTNAFRVQGSGGDNVLKAFLSAGIPGAGVQWAGQIWIRNRISTPVTVHSNQDSQSRVVDASEGWVQVKWVVTGGGVGVAQHQLRAPTVGDVVDCDACFAQYEAKPYHTTWHIGGQQRLNVRLVIPTAGVLDPNEGTIEFWLYLTDLHNWNDVLGGTGGFPSGRWLVFSGTLGHYAWSWAPGPEITTPFGLNSAQTWHHIALRWGGGLKAIFVDGTKKAEGAHDPSFGFPDPFGFGVYGPDPNCLVDDLRISNVARSDADILAGYNSGQPLPVDANTTLKLSFDGPDSVREARALVLGGVTP